jgi:O-antigen ligase
MIVNKWAFRFLIALVFTIPLERVLFFPGVGTFSRMVGLFVLAFAALAVLIEQKIRKFETVQIFTFVFLLWSIITFYWSVDTELSYKSIKTLIQLVIFSFIVWQFAQEEDRQLNLMKAYVYGASIAAFSIIYSYLKEQEFSYFRYSAFGFDPNDIGLTMALAIPMAWYLSFVARGSKIMPWVYRVIVAFLFFATTLTASRGAFVALLVSTLFIVWSFTQIALKYKVALMVFIFAAAGLILKYVPAYSWERIMGISSEIYTGSFSGRLAIWREGLQAFLHNPFFGVGVGGFKTGVEASLGRQAAPHNLFLGIMVGQGLIGLVAFLSIIYSLFVRALKMTSLKRKLWIILLATWVAGVMSLSWELRKPTWFLIGLAAVQTSPIRNDSGESDSTDSEEDLT